MHQLETKVTLNDLIYTIIPNFNTAEKLVNTTLDSLIEASTNPMDILKRTQQRQEFGLEIHRIRLNLEHFLNRHRVEVDAMVRSDGEHKGPVVTPDPQEADAIRSAVDIYQHVCAFQRGERQSPIPGR